MINTIKTLYEKILDVNTKINLLLKEFPFDNFEDFNENLQNYINEKEELIQNLFSLKDKLGEEFAKILEPDLKELIHLVNKLEQENLQLIMEKKSSLSVEINRTNQTSKTLSAYKFNKNDEPAFFDKKD